MGEVELGILAIVCVFLLLLMGVPIAFAFFGVGFLGLSLLSSVKAAIPVLSRALYQVFSEYPYMVIPLFVLMGELASQAGMVKRLYEVFDRWFSHMPGGLALATILTCAGFSALSGSSVATAAAMATVAYPEMRRYGYDPKFAAGTIAAGGTLGFLIPPSLGFVIYRMLTEQSVGKLLISGVVPGVLLTGCYFCVALVWALLSPGLRTRRRDQVEFMSLAKVFLRVWDTLLIFVLVIGGIYTGFFTPTEAAAVGAFMVLCLGLIRRKLSLVSILEAFERTLRISVMVLTLVAGANVFSYFLALTSIPMKLSLYVSQLEVSPYVVFAVIVGVYMVLGCFLDAISMMVLTLPVIFPLVMRLGFDPLWFGVISVLMMEAGLITPPVGLNVYTVAGVIKEVEVYEIFKGVSPFLSAILVVVVLLVLFPELALYLPKTMFRLMQ